MRQDFDACAALAGCLACSNDEEKADQDGIHRSYHVGDSPNLRKCVGRDIEDLLAKATVPSH